MFLGLQGRVCLAVGPCLCNGTWVVAGYPLDGLSIVPKSAVAAAFLGGVEGLVGPRDEHGRVFVAQHLGHPETHGDAKLLAVVAELALLDRLAGSQAALEASSRFVPGSMIANSSPP